MFNPVVFTERVVRDFLRCQLTTWPFADAEMHKQLRGLVNLEQSRNAPLPRGPYVNPSRHFCEGPARSQRVKESVLPFRSATPGVVPCPISSIPRQTIVAQASASIWTGCPVISTATRRHSNVTRRFAKPWKASATMSSPYRAQPWMTRTACGPS